ncbi:MAG: MFS transporter [Chloroflexi bacterium]|nr:MFS transporter [Chloroflexota bacterium]
MVTQLALAWITLELTDSAFYVGVVSAARMAPQLVFGIPAGAVADTFDRRALVVWANAAGAVVLLALVVMAWGGMLLPVALIAASALYGAIDTLRTAATQAYAYDLVRTTRATSGMALTNLGIQVASTAGGVIGGYALEHAGAAGTFGLVSGALIVAALAPLVVGHESLRARTAPSRSLAESAPAAASTICPPEAQAAGVGTIAASADSARRPVAPSRPASQSTDRRPRPDVRGAATLLMRHEVLAVLALGIVLAEVLGFASMTLLPIFAHDVFGVGASGLGIMMAVRSAGGALGLLMLARLGSEGRSGRVFTLGAGAFGLMLLLFAISPAYPLALLFLALAGIGASTMDTLGQTLIQRNVGERERGAAMGLWVFCIGFAPIGHLGLGAAAGAFGAPVTQAASGALLASIAVALTFSRPLRQAR